MRCENPHGLQHIKLAIIHPFMAFSPSRKPVLSEEQHPNVANSLLKYFCS